MRATNIQKSMEKRGYQTNVIVIKGLKTGEAIVSVKINENGYKVSFFYKNYNLIKFLQIN